MEINPVYNISSANLSGNPDLLASLIQKAKHGDQSSFSEIYNLYFKKIYRFIYFRVSHKEAAEDLTEDVFIKAYEKIGGLSKEGSFESWLYQIARNKVIDYYREKKSIVALDEVENSLEYESNIIDMVNLQEQQKFLLKMLKGLGSEQQIVIKLKFIENLENDEIAELLHKSEGAIRVIQHRAIQKLHQLISEYKDSHDSYES